MPYDTSAQDMPAADLSDLEPTDDDLALLAELTWHETQAHLERMLREHAERHHQDAAPLAPVAALPTRTTEPERRAA